MGKSDPRVTVWHLEAPPVMLNCDPRGRFVVQYLTLVIDSFSCIPDREIQCFTLCKKFVILHMLSYTGASLVALLFYSICQNYFEMLHHKCFPLLDSFCIC